MKANDLVELAGRNLRESILRNSLTTLGIGVGVASLVAMLSLGIGLQQLANRRLERSGLFDTVLVTSRRSFRGFDREREQNREGPPPAESRVLDEKARLEMAHLPGVLEATPDIRFITEFRYQDKPHLTMVSGLPPSAKDKDAFDNMQGAFFSGDAADEAILQIQFADELLGIHQRVGEASSKVNAQTQSLIGKELTLKYAEQVPAPVTSEAKPTPDHSHAGSSDQKGTLADTSAPTAMASFSVVPRERKLRIVGITDQEPDGLRGASGGRVFVPLQFVEDLHVMVPAGMRDSESSFSNQPTYQSVSVRVKNPDKIEEVQDAVKKMGFNTFSILDATRSLRRFFAVLDLFLGIFGSLALAVAALGIVNTLVMAILERRREIGIMKAIGASDGDVKKLFFAEAGVMGLFGGMLGVALGWSIGRLINLGTNFYLHQQNLPSEDIWSVPWWLVGGAIAFAIVISMISGLYPAARAARLDPVQALRYE
ncbi:MAG TPA: FtsX-like permease family protein [Terriglobia bacterium]|nr:FtsX-like permease family protein [Terriglobia bacterium]